MPIVMHMVCSRPFFQIKYFGPTRELQLIVKWITIGARYYIYPSTTFTQYINEIITVA